MDIASIQSALKDWVKATVGLPCRFDGDPMALNLKLPAVVILSGPNNMVSVGRDYVQYSAGASTGVDSEHVQPTVVGHREFDIGVRVVSRSQAGNKGAQYWLEALRIALKRPSTLEAFDAAGFAVLSMSAGVQFDAPFEERLESIAAATWRLTAVVADADDQPIGVLTSVGLTTTIKAEDGTVLPSPPNVTNETISAE